MPKKPIVQRVEILAQTRLFRVEGVELQFSNGARCQFERLNKPGGGAVMVLPLLDDALVLINEYAVGTEQYELGFVKGVIDPGETPKQAANRELQEEIGYAARSIHMIRKMTMTPHYSTAVWYMLLAQDLIADPRQGDEPEPLRQTHWPLDNLGALLEHEQISDVRTLHAVYWLRDYLTKTKKTELE